MYPFLLPELGSSSSGGDAADLARRTNPVPNRRVKLVSEWSGLLTADADGKVRYRVRVPQFSGALRIMAVAYKDDAFGSAEFTMKVADPVVISTALPRFASPGDTIVASVTFTNTTKKPIQALEYINVINSGSSAKVKLIHPGPAQDDDHSYEEPLQANAERRLDFTLVVGNQIGSVQLKATCNPDGRTGYTSVFSETIDLPIRPAASLEKRTGSGVIAGGATLPLNLKTDFLPTSLTSRLVVSRSPLTEFSKDLRYLLQYPYGCLEQTVVGRLPAALLRRFGGHFAGMKTGAAAKAQRYNPNYHVQESHPQNREHAALQRQA